MQKPTRELITFIDGKTRCTKIIDTNGKEHFSYGSRTIEELFQSELAKWQATQEPQVLFESETVKVMKFADSTQLELWINKGTGYGILKHQTLFDCSKPILFTKIEDCEMWYAVCNITDDLIQAVQSVNVATVKQAENYRSDKCECGHSIDYDDNHYNFCPNCGKTLIREVE